MDISQFILGIRPEYDGLRIKPCLPAEIKEYTVHRRFRDADYIIHVIHDGTGTGDELIPFGSAGSICHIEVHC